MIRRRFLRLHHIRVVEFQHVGVFQSGVHAHLFVECFPLGLRGFESERDHLAGCYTVICDVHCSVDSGLFDSLVGGFVE